MRKITPEIIEELSEHFTRPSKIGFVNSFRVSTFSELVELTAKLSYKNKDHLLFYRGQSKDYKNKAGHSTFYPSIYRGDYLPLRERKNRFDILEGASIALVQLFKDQKIEGYTELKKRKPIQWSILQHYEVCATPYADFTQSLRVACSFAMLDNSDSDAFVFVFGLPYLTNRISYNSEHDLINIRLLSICPPSAIRPYFQEGYLAGTDDIMYDYDDKSILDFNNRLLAKFVIPNNNSFWNLDFHQVSRKSLYPENDTIASLCLEIKGSVAKELKSGSLGEFLMLWNELEERLLAKAKNLTQRNLSIRESIRVLYEKTVISEDALYQYDRMRELRNRLVHKPSSISVSEVLNGIQIIRSGMLSSLD